MTMPGETEQTATSTETQPDLGSALADISSELFGQSDDDGDKGKAEGAEPTAAAKPSAESEAPPQSGVETAPVEGENTAAVQETGAPATWTKEALEKWATVDPVVQQEILKREEDMHRGLAEYKGRAEIGDQYTKVVEPYKEALSAAKIDPVDLFNNFAANHYLLSFGQPQQKLDLAANLLRNYDIDLIELATYIGNAPEVDPKIAELEARLERFEKGATRQTEQTNDTARQSIQRQIDAFAADPKNTYFTEVANDIVGLLNAGAATSLQEAYDKAVYANPVTRQKEIDRLTAAKLSETAEAEKARKDEIARTTAADVKTRENSRNGTVPLGSMDDTLTETLGRIRSAS